MAVNPECWPVAVHQHLQVVERDFRKYLDCGIPARGFARPRCKDCGHDDLIAFSCKARGACPSCNTRRMVEIAAHLVDHVRGVGSFLLLA